MEHFYHNGIKVFADYARFPNQLVFNKLFDALDARFSITDGLTRLVRLDG